MRRLVLTLALLCPLTALASPLATVGNVHITQEMIKQINPQAEGNPALQKEVIGLLKKRILLAEQVEASGKYSKPALTAAIENYRMGLLANAAMQNYWGHHPITPAQINDAYAALKKQYPMQQVRYREIIVDDASTAREILAQLRQGKSFSTLAAEQSTAANAEIGGEVGWQAVMSLPAPFAKYLEHAQPMEVFGPINLPSGWGVVQFLQKRSQAVPPLAAVKPQLEQGLREKQIESYLNELQSNMAHK